MKSYRTIISLLLMFVVMFSAAAVSVSADSNYIRGDADGDGKVTIRDVTRIQKRLVQFPTPGFNVKAADVDGDGLKINDATKIQRYLAEIDNPCHIGELVSDNTQPTQDEYELPFVPN